MALLQPMSPDIRRGAGCMRAQPDTPCAAISMRWNAAASARLIDRNPIRVGHRLIGYANLSLRLCRGHVRPREQRNMLHCRLHMKKSSLLVNHLCRTRDNLEAEKTEKKAKRGMMC